jgi:hypothetical protein
MFLPKAHGIAPSNPLYLHESDEVKTVMVLE